MTRRRSVTLFCAEEGCRERAYYEVHTLKEDRELRAKPWRCLRHTRPDEVLMPDTPERTTEWVSEEKPYGRFWRGVNGFAHGPGFKVWADDFPAGSRLIVTARVESPEGEHE